MNKRDNHSCPHEAYILVAGTDNAPAHVQGRWSLTPVRKSKVWEQHREMGLCWMGCQEKLGWGGNNVWSVS